MAARSGTIGDIADYLVDGYWSASGGGDHKYNTSGSNVITVNLAGLDDAGRTAARTALAAWESVANIRFDEVTSGGQLRFDDSQDGATSTASYNPSSGSIVSATVLIGTSWLAKYGSAVGTYGYQTYLHEIGHALGLGHPGTYSGGATYAGAAWTLDSWQLTVMSYLDQDENPNIAAGKAYVVTPMMADILAIQEMYGAARGSLTAGNTVWGENTTLGGPLGSVFGRGPGSLQSNALTVFDEGGIDTFKFIGTAAAQRINLNAGSFSSVYGQVDNLGIAPGTTIEKAFGGQGNDRILGNAASNELRGSDGHDVIDGGAGADSLYGGNGRDALAGKSGSDWLWGHSGDDRLSGHEARDILFGCSGNDQLYAGDGNDSLDGGIGRDRLDGGLGDDVLDGQGGTDVLVFRGGRDRILSFEDDVDTILLDSSVWGGGTRTVDWVLGRATTSGATVVLDFGSGNVLTVEGAPSLAELRDDLGIL